MSSSNCRRILAPNARGSKHQSEGGEGGESERSERKQGNSPLRNERSGENLEITDEQVEFYSWFLPDSVSQW
jgi:hypothetical protein